MFSYNNLYWFFNFKMLGCWVIAIFPAVREKKNKLEKFNLLSIHKKSLNNISSFVHAIDLL
jgi:hypothetical protein